MRRFIIAASLLGLVACGEQVAPESQEPSQAPVPETSQAEQGVANCSDTWECSCVKHTTQAACLKSWPPCYWAANKCYPTYE
jgi:hypothetical protein